MTKVLQVLFEGKRRTLVLYAHVQPTEVASLLAAIFNLSSSRSIVGFRIPSNGMLVSLSDACSDPNILPHEVLLESQSGVGSPLPVRPSTAPSIGSKSPVRDTRQTFSASARKPSSASRPVPACSIILSFLSLTCSHLFSVQSTVSHSELPTVMMSSFSFLLFKPILRHWSSSCRKSQLQTSFDSPSHMHF